MAFSRRLPVCGQRPACAHKCRLQERIRMIKNRKQERARKLEKSDDFIVYHSSEDEDEEYNDVTSHQILFSSNNFVDYLRAREFASKESRSFDSNYGTRHVLAHDMLKEHSISLDSEINKIFCSAWLSHRQVVFGTKCNKLMVYDVITKAVDRIPCLVSSNDEYAVEEHSGIHSLDINPSRSMLATGGKNANEIGIYKLPTLDPAYVGEHGHDNLIFDIAWLDDQLLVSCSRDSKLALWRVPELDPETPEIPSYSSITPLSVRKCKTAHKFRAFAFNQNFFELAALSMNGYVHIWNVEDFKQKITTKLPSSQESICICVNENGSLYAIGCKSYTLLIDTRCLQLIKKIATRHTSIRSTSFKSDLLTIGSGTGVVMFWDLRAQKYLDSGINSSRTVTLKTNRSYSDIVDDFNDHNGMPNARQNPAIYTHCYDHSGLRLFCGGGPLPNHLYGNYACIWQ